MKTNKATSYKWAYLPFVFSSAAILATSVTAAPYGQQYQAAKQVNNINQEYVGGGTQLGVSITDGGNIGLEINQVISENQNGSTSVGLWGDYDLDGENEGLQGRGAQINHNWVSRDKAGRATHVNKVTAAYDRSASGHEKATVGYGQENQSTFWDVHASKGLTGRKSAGSNTSNKAYDYGVGAGVGTFLKGSNVRVRAGLDHEWGDDVGAGENTARNTTLSAGVEKFFQGTPHSLALDVAASTKSGGYDNGSDDNNVNGRVTYRYDFGGASIYQPDRRYKRVRVEVPGRAVAPRYKSVPTYSKKIVKKPYKQLIKSTVALEGQTFFKLNSAKLIPSAQSRLKQIATEIRKNGYKGSIRITGNTCGLGDPVYDQKLSEQRARAVRAFLIKNGFNANHLIARGLGKGHPKYPNTPDQGFKNRRVDVEYVSERKSYKTGYRTETQNVRTGTKNVLISKGKLGTPRVIWRTEAVPTAPAWIKRAMHNNIQHNRSVNTYISTDTTTTPVAPLPIAKDDTVTLEACSSKDINVLNGDTFGAGLASVAVTTQPAHGTAVLQSDNTIRYTPNDDYVGSDSFTYTITDVNGKTSTATVSVNITNQCQSTNVAPVAQNDSATTTSGQSVTLATLSNDSDADNDTLTISNVQQPAHGTATITTDGKGIIYTPNASFVGTETFSYTISDGKGHTATATETVTVDAVTPVNVAPVAQNDSATTLMGQPVTLTTLSNDSDADSDTLTITNIQQPANGTAVVSSNGLGIIYTPNAGFTGTETFSYTISDGKGHTATATETVKVNPPANVAPVANNDSATANCDAITIKVLNNDTDADNDSLSIITLSDPSLGTAVINGNNVVYTPVSSCGTGTDTFAYTISDGKGHTATANITVDVKGDGSCNTGCTIAESDDIATTVDTPVSINVLSNDSGSGLQITDIDSPKHGTAMIMGNSIKYTPTAGFTGTDSFWYGIKDSKGYTTSALIVVYVEDTGCNSTCD